MQYLRNLLNEPYPLEENPGRLLVYNLLTSVLVVLFIFAIKPFNLGNVTYTPARMILVYAGYTLVTFLCCIIADKFIRPAFPKFFSETEWTTGKHIVWMELVILIIALGNLSYSSLMGYFLVSGTALLVFQFTVLAYSFVPVVVFTFINKITLENRNLSLVKDMSSLLSRSLVVRNPGTEIILPGEQPQETMKIGGGQFLYAESAGTYTDVVFMDGGIVKRALIKTPLSHIESSVSGDCFLRVHPLFMVNVCKVKGITGSAQGCRLWFEEIDETIPVARSAQRQFMMLMQRLHPATQVL
jgi:hypothetical protein